MQSAMTFEKVFDEIKTYIHRENDLNLIKKAYEFASFKHKDQTRKSGEAYIIHPLEVTFILATLHVGPNTLAAGLLHDTVEDTETSLADITNLFNSDVASIVDGVTKVGKMTFSSLEKAQAENHQKMLLAMAKDIRVIIVKLADRLHNMRTLQYKSSDSKVRIAEETLEIYAPLANRLGMYKIKAELEDRSLRYVDPPMYNKITNLIKHKKQQRVENIDNMISDIEGYLKPNSNLEGCIIKGRIKNIYSIYKKMISQNKQFEDIYDVLAIRIIVSNLSDCYQVLGIIHAHYTPLSNRFKDYIAVPKPNMYQSLHTTVIGVEGQTYEIQIRTYEMDKIAELGVAAHWAYKENVEYSKDREQFEIGQKLKWYGELLKYSEENNTAEEFVETIKGDYLDANVYVYTPSGEVVDLPTGSTAIDFAYKIHTNLGNSTVGAIVNNKIVPLSYELKTGDIVSIRTNKNSFGPSEDWLKIVKTNHAKHKIKAFLNKQNRDVLIESGKDAIEKEFSFRQINLEITDRFVKENFSKNNVTTAEDLYLEIGKGIISVKTVAAKAQGGDDNASEDALQKAMDKTNRILTTKSETGVVVDGLKNPLIKLGNCCSPIPGDEIVGYITRGNGIVVHHKGCGNITNLEKERFIKVYWAANITRKYPVFIKITASQHTSLIPDIINTINSSSTPIASMNAINSRTLSTVIKLKLLVSGTIELEKLIVNLKKIEFIHNIERDSL